MWNKLESQNDIDKLMECYGYFHDSVLKELFYVSGAYINNDLSMMPVNSMNEVRMIFQRQYRNPFTIELVFEKIICFHLMPAKDEFSADILEAHMSYIDGQIYWSDTCSFENLNLDTTFIQCYSAKWRVIEE